MSRYRTLLSNTALISVGVFGSKLLVFFMVRFYTSCLTPSDYGSADLIIQTANLLFPVISLGITESVFRFALDEKSDRPGVFTVGVCCVFVGGLLFFAAAPLLRLYDVVGSYTALIVIYVMTDCFHALCAHFIRAMGKTALYAVQGITNTLMIIILNILFLAVFRLGVAGYVLSVAVANVLNTVFIVIKEKLWRYLTPKPPKSVAVRMLKYSVPMIPTTIFWWVTNVSDRYMVSAMISSEMNGLYAVAYKIPTLLTIVSGVFISAWQFSAVSEASGIKSEHTGFFSEVWSFYSAGLFIAGSLLIAGSRMEMKLLVSPEFSSAWRYVPLLCLATVFSAFVTFMGSVYMVTEKSVPAFLTSFFGAAVNIALNFLLIPSKLGVYGAAIATFVCYFAVFLIRARNARRLIPFRLGKLRLTVGTLLLAIQTAAMTLWPEVWAAQLVPAALIAISNSAPIIKGIKKLVKKDDQL